MASKKRSKKTQKKSGTRKATRSPKQKANDKRLGAMARKRAKVVGGAYIAKAARKTAKRKSAKTAKRNPYKTGLQRQTFKGRKDGLVRVTYGRKNVAALKRHLAALKAEARAMGVSKGELQSISGPSRSAAREAIIIARAARSGAGTSEIVVPGDAVVAARARQIAAPPTFRDKPRQPGHTPINVLLRRIKMIELDILKAVKAGRSRGDIDEMPYIAKNDPPELVEFLSR